MSLTHRIKYKDHNGFLDIETGMVQFYDIIYNNINDAIKLEKNLVRDKQESMFTIGDIKIPKPKIVSFRSFRTQYES